MGASFKLEENPGGQSINFQCSGDPLDQMNLLINAMKQNDHARAVILSVSNLWLEQVSKDHLQIIYNHLKNKHL